MAPRSYSWHAAPSWSRSSWSRGSQKRPAARRRHLEPSSPEPVVALMVTLIEVDHVRYAHAAHRPEATGDPRHHSLPRATARTGYRPRRVLTHTTYAPRHTMAPCPRSSRIKSPVSP